MRSGFKHTRVPHWRTSFKVVQINTLAYLGYSTSIECSTSTNSQVTDTEEIEQEPDKVNQSLLNAALNKIVKGHALFDLKTNNLSTLSTSRKFDTWTLRYFSRPSELEGLSHNEYSQNRIVTRKRKISVDSNELYDLDRHHTTV